MKLDFQSPKGPILKLKGSCISLIGDDIDTDRIIPARFLKCIDFNSLGKSVFADDRKDLGGKHPFDLELNKGASILIVNSNFGCGSSREHAPQALMRWGIRAIIGEGFADIFYSNCIAIGIPCFTLDKSSLKKIQSLVALENIELEIDIEKNTAKSNKFKIVLGIKDSTRNMFVSGEWDATSTLLNNLYLIEKKMHELPYVKFNKI